jgi:PAS domain S-box-containing protein
MTEQRLYNSRVISTFVEYLRNVRPDVDINELLLKSGIAPHEVEDEGHWLTQRQVDSFHDVLLAMTNDPMLFRGAGRYMISSRSITALRQFLISFMTPIQAFAMVGKFASYLSQGTSFKTNKISPNKVEIITIPFEGVREQPYQCENRMGIFEAVVTLFTNKSPVMEHPVCVHHGGDCCRYILSWEVPSYVKWRRIRNYLGILSLIILISFIFSLSPVQIIVLGASLIGLFTGAAFYTQYLEKKDAYTKMAIQGDAANRLLDQITIGYNNALLVQEIGQAVSSILDVDKLITFVIETLQKRLNFDRGTIMLANHEKTMLIYVNGYGYSSHLEALLQETQFHLDNPKSKGPFVVAFKQQKPILVSDISDMQSDISARSFEFAEALGVSSFICVPIIYKGKSEGILAVDNYRSGRPHNQSEVNLLMGIAQQIGISINNARSLHQIMESEERFRTLSENSPDIIYTTDNRGAITYINPAATEILKYDRDELIGRNFAEFAKTDEVNNFIRLFQRVEQGKDTIKNFDAKLLAKDSTERLFYMSGAPNFSATGEITGVVGTLKDVTEQRKLEQQLHHAARMNAIGRLTGGISHDFNNILHAIKAYNQLLTLNKTDSDKDWKYLMSINELTKRATDLVSQLLIFSRKVESKLAAIDINEEIRNFYGLLLRTIPKTIILTLDLADNIYHINGDSAQMGQVIMNLTVNAKDAMPEGGELRIQTRNADFEKPYYRSNIKIDAGKYLLFSVSDTGHGIEKKDLDHIFEPFFTTKEAGKGTGIGLSVVYGIVKNHGGYIFCTSELGKGTTFDLYLPAMDAELIRETRKPEEKSALSKGRETIVLVDDEPSLLETGQELLSLLGYHVLTANSGACALEVIEREKENVDLVILDLMMPGMSGEICLPKILNIIPSMKVMIASGYTANVKMDDILKAGAIDFIYKPYDIEALSKKIRGILDQSATSS